MKKLLSVLLILTTGFMAVGCSSEGEVEASIIENKRAVSVEVIEEQRYPVELNYIGTVTMKDSIKYAFKSGGRVKKIHVEKGQEVKKGDIIAELDKTDLINQSEAVRAQVSAAKSQYNKALNGASQAAINRAKSDVDTARTAFEFAKEQYNKVVALNKTGAVSEQTLDEVEYQFNMASNTYDKVLEGLKEMEDGARSEDIEAARATYNAVQNQYEMVAGLVDDAILYAVEDGIVMEVFNEESEIVGQGYPVVVTRGRTQVISVGLTQKDIDVVEIGYPVKVSVNDKEVVGKVSYIADIPDMATRTYNVEITVKNNEFRLGSIGEVMIPKGEELGKWIPLKSIFSNGEDYVYVINDERAYKKTVKINYVNGPRAMVSGLEVGDAIVVDGMKYLDDGKKVAVQVSE